MERKISKHNEISLTHRIEITFSYFLHRFKVEPYPIPGSFLKFEYLKTEYSKILASETVSLFTLSLKINFSQNGLARRNLHG